MKYIIANFKSHKTQKDINQWLQTFHFSHPNVLPVLALSFPYLHLLPPHQHLLLAAQDVSPFPPGSYTGAVNASQLKDLGVSFCLVGHSERRHYFHETPVDIANKVKELLSVDITPIICLSREDLAPQFACLSESDYKYCFFAYETMANIGGNQTTPISDLKDTIAMIKNYTNNQQKGIIYGGSITLDNVDSVINYVDGVIVGHSSLTSQTFQNILHKVSLYV